MSPNKFMVLEIRGLIAKELVEEKDGEIVLNADTFPETVDGRYEVDIEGNKVHMYKGETITWRIAR